MHIFYCAVIFQTIKVSMYVAYLLPVFVCFIRQVLPVDSIYNMSMCKHNTNNVYNHLYAKVPHV